MLLQRVEYKKAYLYLTCGVSWGSFIKESRVQDGISISY